MVWFQCEDCGENLKKPKLPNHFRCCSANKLSCIDCGVTFGQESVQGHNQCISEAEKYGPKGQGKANNNTPAKANNNGAKPKPEVDINVGLSTRHPWFCSLCNTNATSQQTLLLHADGKKHRAKARAYHASMQPPKQTEESTPTANGSTVDTSKEESTPTANGSTVDTSKEESLANKDVEEGKGQNPPKNTLPNSSEEENGSVPSKKKRKHETSKDLDSKKKEDCDNSGELSNGEVIQAKRKKAEEQEGSVKKIKNKDLLKEDENADSGDTKDAKKKKIKWKKLISSVLKSNPDGALKMKKLQKLVLKSVLDSCPLEDEASLKDTLVNKINSSSKFIVDNKIVRLAAKE